MPSLAWLSGPGGAVSLLALALSYGQQGQAAAITNDQAIRSCNAMMDGKLPSPAPSDFQFSGNVRQYYIAAQEITWDYAPTGWDNWLGVPLNSSPRAQTAGATQYGTKWLKALYRGYTDATFKNLTQQPPWQGTQGPTIRAEVGDLIEILFVNNLTKNYATMHSMGLAYTKTYEGSNYPTTNGPNVLPPGDSVAPGNCVVYKWFVDSSNGPSGGAPSMTHSYHSYVSLQEDSNSGLIGPTIIYAPGKMASTMSNYREFPILYNIYMEPYSFLSGQNKVTLAGGSPNSTTLPSGLPAGNMTVWKPQLTNYLSAQQFSSAPSFYALNGYIFANNPTFQMCLNDNVIWYVNAYGQASHAFHMHGNGFSYMNGNAYAESVNDGVGKTLFMTAYGEGLWQVICHVADHQAMGMVANYQVFGSGQCPLKALGS